MDSKEKVYLELIPGYLNGELIVKLYFKYYRDIINIIKILPGRRWNKQSRYWYIHHRNFDLAKLIDALELFADIDYTALEAFDDGVYEGPLEKEILSARTNSTPKQVTVNKPEVSIELSPEYYEKLIRRRYSPNTIKTYVTYMKSFIVEFREKDLN